MNASNQSDSETKTEQPLPPGIWTTEAKFLYWVWTRFFAVVGRVYCPEFTAKPDWYLKSSWTPGQREAFREFVIRASMEGLGLKKRQAVGKASRFIRYYGWAIDDRMAEAVARGEILKEKMAVAEGGGISCKQAAGLLGITQAAVLERWRDHRLIAWGSKRKVVFPSWQFKDGSMLTGIEDVLRIFHSDDQWRVVRYFLCKRHSLRRRRPLDLLRCGKVAEVIKHAKVHAEENTW
jgi:hypothetical protein